MLLLRIELLLLIEILLLSIELLLWLLRRNSIFLVDFFLNRKGKYFRIQAEELIDSKLQHLWWVREELVVGISLLFQCQIGELIQKSLLLVAFQLVQKLFRSSLLLKTSLLLLL